MKGEDEGQVHQLFRLRVENASGVCLLEVIGIRLVRVEVTAAELRHLVLLPKTAGVVIEGSYNPPRELEPAAAGYDSAAVLR